MKRNRLKSGQSWKSIFLSNFRLIFRSNPKSADTCLAVVERFHQMETSKGIFTTIKYFKEVERYVRMTYLQQNPTFNHDYSWTKMDCNGMPLFLKVNHNFKADPEYNRAVLSALGYYKLYSLSPDETVINGITESGSMNLCSNLLDEIETFSEKFFKERGISPFLPSDSLPIYATTKAGASGPSAMGETSIVDSRSIVDLGIYDKILNILPYIYTKNRVEQFKDIFSKTLSQFKYTFKYRPKNSRIHLLSEGGGKTRAICIPDIWTQSTLKPIHEFLMNSLKKMPNDGTFSHSAIAERVRVQTNRHGLYCYDLKSATDRFPLEVQKRVLKPLLGSLVEGWSSLISERDFSYKKRLIRYAVGQPMGMLSSWAAFSISHHVIINFCKKDKSFYAVIGDDMVLESKEAAERYSSLLDQLEVKISDEKSLLPKDGTKVAEIAKRYFRDGFDISPIPPRVLLESTKSVEGFCEFREVLASRTNYRSSGKPGLDWSETLTLLWKHNKDSDSEAAQALVTCPTFLPAFTGQERKPTPITGLSDLWDISKERLIINLWDRFILNETATRLSTNQVILRSSGMGSVRPGPTEIGNTPLIQEYLDTKRIELLRIGRLYAGIYVDEEGDSFEPSPQQTLQYLLSEPDPYSPKDFQEKRRIRRKRSLELIQKFWIQNRRVISPPRPIQTNESL